MNERARKGRCLVQCISPDDVIVRTTRSAGRLFEQRMLVITAHDSMLHRFNDVGTYLWQFLERPRRLDDICAAVADHFCNFDPSRDAPDIVSFITTLRDKKLVSISGSSRRHCDMTGDAATESF